MIPESKFNLARIEYAARLFKIAVHPDRYRILQLLEEKKELNVTQIHTTLNLKQAETSHHTTMMLDYGLVTKIRRGKESIYSVTPGILELIEKYTDELCKWG